VALFYYHQHHFLLVFLQHYLFCILNDPMQCIPSLTDPTSTFCNFSVIFSSLSYPVFSSLYLHCSIYHFLYSTIRVISLSYIIQRFLIFLVAYIVMSLHMTVKLAYYSTIGYNPKPSKSWQPYLTYLPLRLSGLLE